MVRDGIAILSNEKGSKMSNDRDTLLEWIEADRDKLIGFFSELVAAKSPNPPGDTREAVAHITSLLDAEDAPYRLIIAHPEMPNIVGTFKGGKSGRHLVLNGHTDCFPVNENEPWSHAPWSGKISDGKVWGRGAADMKCGTCASIFTFIYLNRMRDRLKGQLTLTAVSDEETNGPYGARYLIENYPEVHGDCCLNGEPTNPLTIRFGEKGALWLKFTVRAASGHGAYTHTTEGANKIAVRFASALTALEQIEAGTANNVTDVLKRNAAMIDKVLGAGACEVVGKVTVSLGVIHGGIKVNMIPSECTLEADIRLPAGLKKDRVMVELDKTLARFPQVEMEEIYCCESTWSDPEGEMANILRANVKQLRGSEPAAIVSLGGTDARLWRQRQIPAYIYGPAPTGMGSSDEYVEIEDFLHIVRTHVLSAYDYLTSS